MSARSRAAGDLPGPATSAQVLWALLGTLFVLLMAWTALGLAALDLDLPWPRTWSDFASCFAQVAMVWCLVVVAVALATRLLRRPLALSVVVANLVALTYALDTRSKITFLQPLSFRSLLATASEAATLSSAAPLYFSSEFILEVVATLLLLNLSWWLAKRKSLAITSGRVGGAFRTLLGRASPALPALGLVAVALTKPQPYHLDDGLWSAGLASAVRAMPPSDGGGAVCDQPRAPFQLSGTQATGLLRGRSVVIFIGESWGFSATSLADPDCGTTPFLMRLAEHDGLGSGAMRAQFSFSTKALYSLLTGRYASPGMQVAESYQPKIDSLPSALRNAGFATVFFSTQWLDWQNTRHQYESMGFERVEAGSELELRARKNGKTLPKNSYGVDDSALLQGLVDSLPRDRPFLSVFYSVNTHVPYFAPGDTGKYDPTERHFERALRYSDSVLQRLVAEFERASLLSNVLLVVVGDHGENFREGSFRSRSCLLTEAELNGAFVLAAPGLSDAERPKLDFAGARQIDLVPTVLDLLGIRTDLEVQGRSLLRADPPPRAYIDSYGTCELKGFVEGSAKVLYDVASQRLFQFDLSPGGDSLPREVTGAKRQQTASELLSCGRYHAEALVGSGIERSE